MPELPQQPAGGQVQVNTAFPKPPIEPGAATEAAGAMGQAAEQMATEIGVKLNEVRRTNQVNLAEAEYRERADDISYQVLRDPKYRSDPDGARAQVSSQLEPLQAEMRAKYPAADWDGMLTKNMTVWGDSRARVVSRAAIGNLETDTKDEIKAHSAMAINARLTAADPADGVREVNQHRQMIDVAEKSGLLSKGEADLDRTEFEFTLSKAVYEDWAQKNPGVILAQDKPPAGVLPDQWRSERDKAISNIEFSQKNANAVVEAQLGGLAQDIIKKAANNQPYGGDLETYMAKGGSQKLYEGLTGQQWIRSNPTLRDSYIKTIEASGPEELPFILDGANTARGAQNLSSADLAMVNSAAIRHKSEGMDAQKAAEAEGLKELRDEFIPPGKIAGTYEFGTPKVDWEGLEKTYNSYLLNHKHDVEGALKATREKYKKYMIGGDAGLKDAAGRLMGGAPAPTAAATPAGVEPRLVP